MTDRHHYEVTVTWTGNTGSGTSGYRDYSRAHEIAVEGKATIAGSSDTAFRGEASRWNPEEMLVAALSSCHQLAYLHLCADAGLVVTAYRDAAEGTMRMDAATGSGQFTEVVLRPRVTFADAANEELTRELHHKAHELCFIANSVNFTVRCEPVYIAAEELVASGR